mgnify:CR=1 FL=1
MHRRTKALDISRAVKEAVWERDGHRCILCGSIEAAPNAHYIARSHGGLGIPENIVTLCWDCHQAYDNGTNRRGYREMIRSYLQSQYPAWKEDALVYRKGR